MIYYTHAGRFHCDEVAGYVITALAGVCNDVIRLESLSDIPQDGVIADIGRQYIPSERKFDHHQELLLRENGHAYATAGLLWKEYGKQAIENVVGQKHVEAVWEEVDIALMQGIDANDADSAYIVSATDRAGEVEVQILSRLMGKYNLWDINDHNGQRVQFVKAALVVKTSLVHAIQSAYNYQENLEEFPSISSVENKVCILSKAMEWRRIITEHYPEVLYVLTPSDHTASKYMLVAVPQHAKTRDLKKPIERPKWFKDFIHLGKWIAGSDSIDDLKKLALYNLNL